MIETVMSRILLLTRPVFDQVWSNIAARISGIAASEPVVTFVSPCVSTVSGYPTYGVLLLFSGWQMEYGPSHFFISELGKILRVEQLY